MSASEEAAFARARAYFEELVESDGAVRAARLAAIARNEAELLPLLERWLASDAAASGFLETPAAEIPGLLASGEGASDGGADGPGLRCGPYRLRALIGRGGMGEVWEAERSDGQFEQIVAVKRLRIDMDSEEGLRRFLRERQILARLAHPGIARLLDGGMGADGRPYIVMEKVDGRPITVFAGERALSIAERLRLVIAVAEAVDAAHHQLVVHRDLKPSNILVSDAGELKLLDFGIAKLLAPEDEAGGGPAAATLLGERALTPAYAAPEQILGGPISTATDVYALGVVLCELLTGQLPRPRRTSAMAAVAELVAELQRGDEVPLLSVVARRTAPAELERAGLPAAERVRLPRLLAGDIDAIAARALARSPTRRYPSALALADDLRALLAGRPLAARPESGLARALRFVRRHRIGVTTAALAAVSLVGGLSVALWQARRAAAAATRAETSARSAENTRDFLISLFEIADPMKSGGAAVSARDLLAQGARRLESELASDPAILADLLEAVARIESSLGLLAEAARSAERARELRPPSDEVGRARAEATLGSIRIQEGDLDDAERRLGAAVATLARGGASALALARARSDYGQVLFWRKRVAEAEAIEREVHATFARELGEEHVETAIHLRNLGIVLDDLGRLDEAEAAYRRSQAILEKNLGAEHANVAQSHLSLGFLLDKRGRIEEAEPLYRRALEIRRRTVGDRHVQTGQTLQLLADFLTRRERFDEAEGAAREALAIFRAVDPDHFEVGKCVNALGLVAAKRGEPARAEGLYREALANFERSLGRDHPFFWWTTGSLAMAIAEQGRLAEAEILQRQVLAELERVSGMESADAQWGYEILAQTLARQGRAEEARAATERALALAAKRSPPS